MARLETQLEALSTILARATLNTIDQRPSSGDWSARENLAHLARRSVRKRWPWAFAVNVNCPSCGRSRLVCQVIVHLNDDHRWTREKIGAWVAGIEPSQPPEDPRGGMMRTAWAPSTIRGHADPASCEELAA